MPNAERNIAVVGIIHAFASQDDIGAAVRATDSDVVPAVHVETAGEIVRAVGQENRVAILEVDHRILQLWFRRDVDDVAGDRQLGRVPGRGRPRHERNRQSRRREDAFG